MAVADAAAGLGWEGGFAVTGARLGINPGADFVLVPVGYASGAELSGTSTFNTTFAALGVRPGTFTWTWGSGANADSLTLEIVPEPSTWSLLGTGLMGLAGLAGRKFKLT